MYVSSLNELIPDLKISAPHNDVFFGGAGGITLDFAVSQFPHLLFGLSHKGSPLWGGKHWEGNFAQKLQLCSCFQGVATAVQLWSWGDEWLQLRNCSSPTTVQNSWLQSLIPPPQIKVGWTTIGQPQFLDCRQPPPLPKIRFGLQFLNCRESPTVDPEAYFF